MALRSRKSPRLVVLICGPYVLVKRSGGCGKVLLRSELRAFRAHLLPHQLADGVRSVEVMPRLHRQRLQHHGADIDRVCLPYDEATPTTLSIDIFFDQDAAGWCPGWADGWNTLIPQIWLPRCFVMIRSFTLLLGGAARALAMQLSNACCLNLWELHCCWRAAPFNACAVRSCPARHRPMFC